MNEENIHHTTHPQSRLCVFVGTGFFDFFSNKTHAAETQDRWAVISWYKEGLTTAEICRKTGFYKQFVTTGYRIQRLWLSFLVPLLLGCSPFLCPGYSPPSTIERRASFPTRLLGVTSSCRGRCFTSSRWVFPLLSLWSPSVSLRALACLRFRTFIKRTVRRLFLCLWCRPSSCSRVPWRSMKYVTTV